MDNATTVSVIDYRRHAMVLQWHRLGGTWAACDNPPALVHGIALIRPAAANICVYGQGGRLWLQVGPDQYALGHDWPRVSCARGIASFGFRRRFTISADAGLLFSHSYWTNQGRDFYHWLAERAADPAWRSSCARAWSQGVAAQALRPR